MNEAGQQKFTQKVTFVASFTGNWWPKAFRIENAE
jgi:hypothetical protein